MKTVLSQLAASRGRMTWVLGLALAAGSATVGVTSAPAVAAPGHKMSARSHRVSAAQANRIARRTIGGNAYVVRNEGVHGGTYRIHVHRGGVARHVFVGTRTGRVVRTRLINRRADRREDRPRR